MPKSPPRPALLAAAAALLAWSVTVAVRAEAPIDTRWQDDLAAIEQYRPGYGFWQHVFTIPDGSIAYGSALDGRLLVTFPTRGVWTKEARWSDQALSGTLDGVTLSSNLDQRRDEVARLLEAKVGPVLHNPTRGSFLLPNVQRYGPFLEEWGAIYERFGVPAGIGLGQAIIESGLDGVRRSEARAVGFCQWLESNWKRLDRLSPHVLEWRNQTTQAPYCAAYLSILATRYGSFIPAVSEHHSGGTNVGRVLINGERLGGGDVRDRYFLGSQAARDLRQVDLYGYRDLYRTYGPRSFFYSEMVFGNAHTVRAMSASVRQSPIYAMRATRAIPIAEVVRRSGLTTAEVKRFNPALVSRVPAGATLYLPKYVREFGADVSFWHRPASQAYLDVLADFRSLDAPFERWEDPAFASILRTFESRFRNTRTEEGSVMATVLAYAMADLHSSARTGILAEFRSSEDLAVLLQQGLSARTAVAQGLVACQAEPEPLEQIDATC